ncbi:MAG TPA: VTT domain-containing protein [Dehalococcoidales bacterium]|nr:VTT domain-containing protein [Dehalococcoidales bacterium]
MDEVNTVKPRMVRARVWLKTRIASLGAFIWNRIWPKTPGGLRKVVWLRRRLLPLLGLLVAIGIMVGIVYLYWRNPHIFRELRAYGYLGAFVISVILNATIILPVSNMTIMMTLGATLPSPLMVGLAGGIGAAIGEMTGYIAGRAGRGLLLKSKVYNRMEGWVKRWGWIAVFVMSIFPFVFDIVGIIAGALRMPFWRFFLACWLGRTVSYVFMTYMASLGFKAIPWFN